VILSIRTRLTTFNFEPDTGMQMTCHKFSAVHIRTENSRFRSGGEITSPPPRPILALTINLTSIYSTVRQQNGISSSVWTKAANRWSANCPAVSSRRAVSNRRKRVGDASKIASRLWHDGEGDSFWARSIRSRAGAEFWAFIAERRGPYK
jgi:hypothetical protein